MSKRSLKRPLNHRRWPFWRCAYHHHASRRLIAAGIIVALAGFIIVVQMVAGKLAADVLVRRYTTLTSARVTGEIIYSGQDFLAPYSSNLRFDGSLRRDASRLQLRADFNGLVLSRPYEGSVISTGSDIYFNLSGPELPVIRFNQSSNLYPIKSGWHKNRFDESLYDWYCEHRPGSTHPSSLELYRLMRSVPAKTSYVNPLGRLNGQRATHIHGRVDTDRLPELLARLNSQLPAGCGFTQLHPGDLRSLKVRYDVWTAARADRIRLVIEDPTLGGQLTISLTADEFGQPVEIIPPERAVDLNNLR